MFDLGRELKRLFRPQPAFAQPKDGLTGGDAALLELLDLNLLRAEARACDVAAGRVGAKDRASRQLEQAVAWRELARRTGDAAALRKAASAAEASAASFKRDNRLKAWAKARAEQGQCAALCAELFGDEGLNAAAAVAFKEASEHAERSGAAAPALARVKIEAVSAISATDAERAFREIAAFEHLLPPTGQSPRSRHARLAVAQQRADLAEIIVLAASRFYDERLAERAAGMLAGLAEDLDPAYEPLTWRRVCTLEGRALVLAGELTGEVARIIDGVGRLTDVLDNLSREHSPLDWVDVQLAHAEAMQSLGEATESVQAFDRAIEGYNRALAVLRREPALGLRAAAGVNRALCIGRGAELASDNHALDEAEANFRCELASAEPRLDPVWWAVCQLALARIYEAQITRNGRDRGERARALLALNEALDVFGSAGLRNLADETLTAIDRLQVRGKVRRYGGGDVPRRAAHAPDADGPQRRFLRQLRVEFAVFTRTAHGVGFPVEDQDGERQEQRPVEVGRLADDRERVEFLALQNPAGGVEVDLRQVAERDQKLGGLVVAQHRGQRLGRDRIARAHGADRGFRFGVVGRQGAIARCDALAPR